ncbi:MAG: DoxX family protein [Maribacter sp.]
MFPSFHEDYFWYTKGLIIFSGISFLFFGISCLFSQFMILEFKRYGLGNFRILVGCLQLLGALGLLLGLYFKNWAIMASLGLSILMALGFLVRLKIKDPVWVSVPSLFYSIINLVLFICLVSSKNN